MGFHLVGRMWKNVLLWQRHDVGDLNVQWMVGIHYGILSREENSRKLGVKAQQQDFIVFF
jgi:hypothetical protein